MTKQFERLASTTAKGRGLPDLKMVVFPFPYDQLPDDKMREIARSKMEEVVQALTDQVGQSRKQQG